MMQFRRVKKRPEQAHCINPQRGSSSNSGLIRIQICSKKYMAPAAQISVSKKKSCCPIPQSESQALKRTVLSSAAHSQEGVSVQASCFSSILRRATQTAEAHLKPEPKESCHTRSPLRTFWNVSTYDHAYLAAANASVLKFIVIWQDSQSLVGNRGTDTSMLLGRSAACTDASLEHFSGQRAEWSTWQKKGAHRAWAKTVQHSCMALICLACQKGQSNKVLSYNGWCNPGPAMRVHACLSYQLLCNVWYLKLPNLSIQWISTEG